MKGERSTPSSGLRGLVTDRQRMGAKQLTVLPPFLERARLSYRKGIAKLCCHIRGCATLVTVATPGPALPACFVAARATDRPSPSPPRPSRQWKASHQI
jgi:hypothetical protein